MLNVKNLIMLLLIITTFIAGTTDAIENETIEAYNLRINGKVNEAKALLEDYIKNNPDDAMANYEMARISLYMLTGDSRDNFIKHIDNAEKRIKKSLSLKPDNITYLYLSSRVTFLRSYLMLQQDSENAVKHVAKLISALETVLEKDPEYKEVLLNMVDVYANLPGNMGGDKNKAEVYVDRLESIDSIMGAKGRAMLLSEDEDPEKFWIGILDKHPEHIVVLEELGKVYLRNNNPDEGIKYLEKVFEYDSSKSTILLDIARFYGYKLMSDQSKKSELIAPAKEAISRYLQTNPIAPLEAYAKNMLARLYFIDGEKKQGEKLVKEAEALDKYYSKASAIPNLDLFIKPGEKPHNHTYFFQPF